MAIEWRDAMSIDHGPIDDDHQLLFELINRCEDVLIKGFDRARIVEALKKLESYAMEHFIREEAIQREIGWPEFEEHAKNHLQIATKVRLALSVVDRGIPTHRQPAARAKIMELLHHWIIEHIMKYDVPMRPLFRKHRAEKIFGVRPPLPAYTRIRGASPRLLR